MTDRIIEAGGYKWIIRPESEINGKLQDELGSDDREAEIVLQVRELGDPDGEFIDIGACVGGFSIRAAKHFKRVFAFEPNSFNRKGLEINKHLNDLENIEVMHHALGEEEVDQCVSVKGGGSKVYENEEDAPSAYGIETVCVEPLDNFNQMFTNVKLIKIDTEGHELPILKGAEHIIKTYEPVLLIETHENTYKNDPKLKNQYENILMLMGEYGYHVEEMGRTGFGDYHLICYPKTV